MEAMPSLTDCRAELERKGYAGLPGIFTDGTIGAILRS
jgi:hypothetical protein